MLVTTGCLGIGLPCNQSFDSQSVRLKKSDYHPSPKAWESFYDTYSNLIYEYFLCILYDDA
jgi:hypothetical protein